MSPRKRPIGFKATDRPLRRDVRLLGELVGAMLREQGQGLYENVEAARTAAIARREGEDGAEARLVQALSDLTAREATELARAFSTYFLVVNLAEKVHRIRRRRDFLRDPDGPAQPGSIVDTLALLRDSRPTPRSAAEIEALVRRVRVEPVFTAHPTEATRRVILSKEQRIARLLVDRLDKSRTPPEERALLARIREEITTAWQTEEHPADRPTVADEREHVLFFITDVLYRIAPVLQEDLEEAIRSTFGLEVAVPVVFRAGSWVGGDMDGNPNVTAATIRETLERHRELILGLYVAECRTLGSRLSQSPARVGIDPAILETTKAYADLFPEAGPTSRRSEGMPYRRFVDHLGLRLSATRSGDPRGYEGPGAFDQDLARLEASLSGHCGTHAGLFGVRRLRRRLAVFGFHLAALDVRQDALVHRTAVGQLLGDPRWAERTAAERSRRLGEILRDGAAPPDPPDESSMAVLDVFRVVRNGMERSGRQAFGPFIISMAADTDDVLTVLVLESWAAGAGAKTGDHDSLLDVCPLLETIDDLDEGPRILERLFSDPAYAAHLERRGRRQIVMIGYSDSAKDGGIVASRRAIERSQARMIEAADRAGIDPLFFHGRGGTVGRGGGRIHRAILAAPPGSIRGTLRLTEQGEMIDERYGLRGIAARNLERMIGAVILAAARPGEAGVSGRDDAVLDRIAVESRRAYRALVYENPLFLDYFRHATPIDVIERMTIGSRPASRRKQAGIQDLRAIPWVFAWTQSRHLLPDWFGLGSGLAAAARQYGPEVLGRLGRENPAFMNLIDDVEAALARADLEIAARYADLAPPENRPVFDAIRREHELTVEHLLTIRSADRLLQGAPTLRRSIRLRNPYVDPMSLLQVNLLDRWRRGGRADEDTFRALLSTVNGIAGGLQSTG